MHGKSNHPFDIWEALLRTMRVLSCVFRPTHARLIGSVLVPVYKPSPSYDLNPSQVGLLPASLQTWLICLHNNRFKYNLDQEAQINRFLLTLKQGVRPPLPFQAFR
jgi:hypothetical protein